MDRVYIKHAVLSPLAKPSIFRDKKDENLGKMSSTHRPVMVDVDWDYMKLHDIYRLKQMLGRNLQIHRTILKYLNAKSKAWN
jgi:hypothetical protein